MIYFYRLKKILKLQNGDIKNETCRNQILNKIIKLSVNDNKVGKTINPKMYMKFLVLFWRKQY